MSMQFEFHFDGMNAPDGEMDAGQLIAVVQALMDVALAVGRRETSAEMLGRAPLRVHRVANLTVGMQRGSTSITAQRATPGREALDFDVSDEAAFDASLESILDSMAQGVRPDWVDDGLAASIGQLASALVQAAPEVQLKVDGVLKRRLAGGAAALTVWGPRVSREPAAIRFVGRLYGVNTRTHRLQVEDDVGNKVGLPDARHGDDIGMLLNRYVDVVGQPERDGDGKLRNILAASISPASDPDLDTLRSVPADEVSSIANAIPAYGIEGLSDAEADAFLDAIGL